MQAHWQFAGTLAIRRKQRLWKKTKRGRNFDEYEAVDKEVKRLIRNAKRSFEKRLANGNGGNSRPFYAYVNQRTKSRPGIGPLKNADKETVSDDHGMVELLNNFFSTVFTREDTGHIPKAVDMETSAMNGISITVKAVRNKIQKLKPDSAAGPVAAGVGKCTVHTTGIHFQRVNQHRRSTRGLEESQRDPDI